MASCERQELIPLREIVCAARVIVDHREEGPEREILVRSTASPEVLDQSLAFLRVSGDAGIDRSALEGQEVYQRAARSTVMLVTPGPFSSAKGTGTLIHRSPAVVLTNRHVVERTGRLLALFPILQDGVVVTELAPYTELIRRGKGIEGIVIATDSKRDLALIRLTTVPVEAHCLPLARESASVGDTVHAVGMGGADTAWRHAKGAVRQVGREQFDSYPVGGLGATQRIEAQVLWVDCALKMGDSGGPLVNHRGELIGVSHGVPQMARRLSLGIDVAEVRDFVDRSMVVTAEIATQD